MGRSTGPSWRGALLRLARNDWGQTRTPFALESAKPLGGAMSPPFRADHVGSFLRPARLRTARERFFASEISAEELRAVEDDCIREVVKNQESVGLKGVTDGEFRRTYFHIDFLERLDGVEVRYGEFASSFR